MTIATYAEATTTQTAAEIETAMLADLDAAGVDTAGLSDLSAERGLVALAAQARAEEQEIRSTVAQTTSIDDIDDDAWLDVVCKGRYDEERLPALKTQGRPTVTASTGGGTQVIAARELRADAGNGVFFVNTQGVTILAGASVPVDFECETAGTIGNVANGAIAGFQRAPAGLTITNEAGWATFTGTDVESNAAYKRRCKAKWGTLGAGWTKTSFDYLIPLYSPRITRWRVLDDNPYGPGTIGIVAANSAGPATVEEMAALHAGLTAPDVMTLGTGGLTVVPATEYVVTMDGIIYRDGSNLNLLSDAHAALEELRLAYPLGGDADGSLRRALLIEVLMGGAVELYGLPGFGGAKNVVLDAPAADIALGQFDVISFDTSQLTLV